MKKLYGLTGPAGSGKDSAADFLCFGHGFTRMAFADPLRQAASAIFGFSKDQMKDRVLKETADPRWGFSPRFALQRLGTESIRNVFGAETWIKRWKLGYDLIKDSDDVVVTDVRFDNEADAIRDMGGVIIHVFRPELDDIGDARSHASEAGVLMKDEDYVLVNDGALSDLRANVISLIYPEGFDVE